MQNAHNLVTKDGFKALEDELEERLQKKEELLKMIEELRALGDTSESEGLTLAQETYQSNEKSIADLRRTISKAEVTENQSTNGKVAVGSKVTVKSEENGQEVFSIVGGAESNPLEMKISASSPLGAALINKKSGEKVTVKLPRKVVEYEIVNVE
ncbi:GreA/GreB family elongation factor [Candidatus Dojkabacteria bacterium]|uniref:GreA/GreB family elongation factor n=1 Tax=Candidatus Dojkabacteria bacterium TaxID=2099670 RepID=A0A955HZ70_9BACT|nr:GreA/GreB family elongation factor [Candidatus Dojkabacteria bacterium]MCB9791086.1 GreA/GreB family elongation factor [Candidatus Nomurabacteria bacterium]